MLGIVFTEFQEFIEKSFSSDMYEDLIDDCPNLKSKGAYTAVGRYDYEEILALVTALSNRIEAPVPDLVKTFGENLFGRFYILYPSFFENMSGSYDFLCTIENHIHVEVKKLYPEAELPTFSFEQETKMDMTMLYSSTRPFADLAEGLINGCIKHYQENITLERIDLEASSGQNHTRFELKRDKS